MLVTRQDILFLKSLATVKDLVAVDSIPTTFKEDFKSRSQNGES